MMSEEYLRGYEESVMESEGICFEEAKSRFVRDFAYGGAIRHLVDRGYTVDRIIEEFHYPLSRESIEKIVQEYLAGRQQ